MILQKDPKDSDGTLKQSLEWAILMVYSVCKQLCSLDEDWIEPLLWVFVTTLIFYGFHSLYVILHTYNYFAYVITENGVCKFKTVRVIMC